MGNFARIIHHLDMKDVKRRHLKELAVKKIKEEEDKKEKEIIQEISKKWKSNWKEELIKDKPEINWTQELNSLWDTNWKDDLDEGMTTQMLTGILPSAGNTDLDVLQLGATGADLSYTTNGDVTDGVFTALTNTDAIDNVNDPHNIGTNIRTPNHPDGNASLEFTTTDQMHTGASPSQPSYVPGDTGGMRGVNIAGTYNPMADQVYVNNLGATNENVPLNHFNGEKLSERIGSYLTWGTGFYAIAGFPRFAALKAVDTTEMDTLSMNWFMFGTVGTDGNSESPTYLQKVVTNPSRFTEPGDGVTLFYWAGDKEGAQSYSPDMDVHSGKHDGWRPINVKPDGTTDNSYSAYLIPHRADGALYNSGGRQRHNGGYPAQVLLNNKITLPPWCRDKNTRFLLHQGKNKIGANSANFGITSVRFQRRNTIRVPSLSKPLTDIETAPFVRVGGKDGGAKERKKRVQDIIRSGLKYTSKQFGDDFPFRTDLK